MEYVDLNTTIGDVTGVFDPSRYLDRLPRLAPDLPAGALAFATAADHYNFHAERCVKDLKMTVIQFGKDAWDDERGEDGENWTEIRFRYVLSRPKPETDLVIRYLGVRSFVLDTERGAASWEAVDEVILDEILPHVHGCSHEIAFHTGTLTVVCRDLVATWLGVDDADETVTG